MCIYEGHRSMCVLNMKFVSSNLWQGEMCTDDDTNDDDKHNGQSMIV